LVELLLGDLSHGELRLVKSFDGISAW